ncbi:MAG TPA: AAA family ATPase [Actinophytocola sp.]|nr:AAA family ATPase [Actinophytocola sp.]
MLVGRGTERRLIEQLVAGARIGQSGVLVITGEPGVGKTALLDDALRHTTGMGMLRAVGSESEREIPFGALHQVLRPALDRLDQIPAPQAQALSAALVLSAGATGDRFAIGAATLSLLCRFAEDRPVAIMLDDLHLFDRPSAEALAFAARRLMADPVVLLATARPAESTEVGEQLPRLALSGIDLAAAGELVSRHAPAVVSPEQVANLHHATDGNPLALIELAGVGAAAASPAVPLPVPDTLVTAFASRARSLCDAGRAALALAAVAGTDLRVIARAGGHLGLDVDALAEAEAAGLVRVADGRVEFRHPLVRAAVYGDLAPERRRAVHRAVAGALGPHEPDRHAWHLAEATLGQDERVADLLAEAAMRAHRRSAHDVAAAGFERAARLSPSVDRHALFCVAAAESAWLAGAGPRAVALLDEAGELSAPGVALRALELRGTIAARTGSLIESRDILRAAVRAAPNADYRVVLLADAVSVCFYLGDATAAVELANEIESALADVTSARARGLGQIAAGVARILANRGGADQIRSAVAQLSSADWLRDDQRRLPWLMVAPLFLRDTGVGDELLAAVDEVRAEAAVGTLPFLLFHVARDEATTNRWGRAEATYDEAVRLARETGQNTELAMSLAGLAWLQARLGRAADCRASVAEALPICRARDIHVGRMWSLFALGELELGLGDPARALVHLQELATLLDTFGVADPDLSPGPELADVLTRLGRRDDAWQVARRYRTAAEAKGQPWAMARAERTVGLLADDAELDKHFAAALELHTHTRDAYEVARTRLAYGARLRRARRRVDARPHLRAALATFEELGAVRWADVAALELEATGEASRRSEPTGVQTLTPQELRVSLLLAEGRTTREVAAALFLSPKTVEYHLRKVYTKLGIRSRAELADQITPTGG